MPNWVTNKLIVAGGSEDELRTFRLKAEGPNSWGERVPLTYHAFIPYPEEYARIDRLFYEWEQLTGSRWAGIGSPEFQEFARKRGFDPAPERDGFNSGGYEWRNENWGTKWDAVDPEVAETEEGLVYHFLSPWSPPIPVILAMSRQHPLIFRLEFEEATFAGKATFQGGEILEEFVEWWREEERGLGEA